MVWQLSYDRMNTGNLGYMDMIPLGQPYIGLVFSAVFVIFLEGLEWYLVRDEYGSWDQLG